MTPKRLIIAGVILIVVLILSSTMWVDNQSCLRANSLRIADQNYYQGVANRSYKRAQTDQGILLQLDLDGYQAAITARDASHPLRCTIFFPATK